MKTTFEKEMRKYKRRIKYLEYRKIKCEKRFYRLVCKLFNKIDQNKEAKIVSAERISEVCNLDLDKVIETMESCVKHGITIKENDKYILAGRYSDIAYLCLYYVLFTNHLK